MKAAATALAIPALVAMLPGCAGGSQGAHDELAFLRVGVRPSAEASLVLRGLERGGYRLHSRVDGSGFVALLVIHSENDTSGLRIITRRGTVLSLDAEGPHDSLSLMSSPDDRSHDIDGDGREEVVVARHDASRVRTCIGVFRVGPLGALLWLTVGDPAEDGAPGAPPVFDACVEELRDVGGTDAPEALVRVRLDSLSRGRTPTVDVPFSLEADGLRFGAASDHARYFDSKRRQLHEALAQAREGADVELVFSLAVELAYLECLVHGGSGAARAAFDGALGELPLSPSQARSIGDARDVIDSQFASDDGSPPQR